MKTIELTDDEYILLALMADSYITKNGDKSIPTIYKLMQSYGAEMVNKLYDKFADPPSDEAMDKIDDMITQIKN